MRDHNPTVRHSDRGGRRSAAWTSRLPCWRSIPDGPAIWAGCLRRVGSWRVPPHWSSHDWLEEMHAQGAAAACQAMDDFDPERGVPRGAFVRLRILSSLRTRYRQEWSVCAPLQSCSRSRRRSESARRTPSPDPHRRGADGPRSRGSPIPTAGYFSVSSGRDVPKKTLPLSSESPSRRSTSAEPDTRWPAPEHGDCSEPGSEN